MSDEPRPIRALDTRNGGMHINFSSFSGGAVWISYADAEALMQALQDSLRSHRHEAEADAPEDPPAYTVESAARDNLDTEAVVRLRQIALGHAMSLRSSNNYINTCIAGEVFYRFLTFRKWDPDAADEGQADAGDGPASNG